MLDILIYILVYSLALYGGLSLIISIVNTVSERARQDAENIRLVLMVKNCEERIESDIRALYSSGVCSRVIPGGKLLVVDMGSNDTTLNVLSSLNKEYENLEVVEEDDKEKIFGCFYN